jgi:hypothetical protein
LQAAHGWIAKYAGNGGFTKRYLVQRGSILLYYESYSSSDPKGAFILDGTCVQRGAKLVQRNQLSKILNRSSLATRFCAVLTRPSGLKWEICLPTEKALDRWLEAFDATGVVRRLPDIPLEPDAPPPAVPSPGPPRAAPRHVPGHAPPPAQWGSPAGSSVVPPIDGAGHHTPSRLAVSEDSNDPPDTADREFRALPVPADDMDAGRE